MTNAQSKHITKRTHYPAGKALRKLCVSRRCGLGYFKDTMDELYERVGDLYTVPKDFDRIGSTSTHKVCMQRL